MQKTKPRWENHALEGLGGKTEAWLIFNEREVLKGYGKRKHEQAVNKAEEEWDAYQRQLDSKVNEIDMKALEAEIKTLKQGED